MDFKTPIVLQNVKKNALDIVNIKKFMAPFSEEYTGMLMQIPCFICNGLYL